MKDPEQISDDAITTTGDDNSVANLYQLRPSDTNEGVTVTFDAQGNAPTISVDLTNGNTQTVDNVERISIRSVDGNEQRATVTLYDENGVVVLTREVTSLSPVTLPADTKASSVVVQPQQVNGAPTVEFQLEIHACVKGKSYAFSSISVN